MLVLLRAAAGPTVLVGVLAIVLGAVLRGGVGALGALLGVLLVLAFFAVGQYALGVILANNPQAALTGALALYLVQVGVLFGLIALLKDATVIDPKVFALTVVACTLTWTCAEVWTVGRTNMLVVEPGTGPGAGGTATQSGSSVGDRP